LSRAGETGSELVLESRQGKIEKYCHKITQQHLSRDHHPNIAFVTVRTVAVKQHTPLDLLSDAGRKDLVGSAETATGATVEVLAETIGENDPASPRYQAGLRDDIRTRKDGRSIAATEITSSILALTNRSWHRCRQDLRGSRIDL
jgi:hypothetical protein